MYNHNDIEKDLCRQIGIKSEKWTEKDCEICLMNDGRYCDDKSCEENRFELLLWHDVSSILKKYGVISIVIENKWCGINMNIDNKINGKITTEIDIEGITELEAGLKCILKLSEILGVKPNEL